MRAKTTKQQSVLMRQALEVMQTPIHELVLLVSAEIEKNPIVRSESDTESLKGDITNEALEADSINPLPEEEVSSLRQLWLDEDNYEPLNNLDPEMRDFFDGSGDYNAQLDEARARDENLVENAVAAQPPLEQLLLDLARAHFTDPLQLEMAEEIIGELDESGLLSVDLRCKAALHLWDETALQEVLREIQRIGPPGVAARSTQESLLLHLEGEGRSQSLAYRLVREHYDDVLHNRFPAIQRHLNLPPDLLHKAIREDLEQLGLHPETVLREFTPSLVPDVDITQEEHYLTAKVISHLLPPIRYNQHYIDMLDDPRVDDEAKEYLHGLIRSIKWLLLCVERRNHLLMRIADYLIEHRPDYLTGRDRHLLPIPIRTIAEALNVHNATILRAIDNKTLSCPLGTLPLNRFFTHSQISAEPKEGSAKALIRELLEVETRANPLSDEKLSALLAEEGIKCARRTVAKYRSELGIPNARERRRR